jgi:hypothetical protein
MSQSIEAPVFTLQYGDIELVLAEHTLSRNTAPFTAFSLSNDDLNAVEDARLLDAFRSQFNRLEELLPKCIPVLRAYATLIIFYRISKNPTMLVTYQQAKAQLMGENAEDTLLFIVAKLLRHDDNELRRYFQQPHILVSSLLKVKQDFILGEGNVIRLFQEARTVSEEKETRRLTMKEFTALYQRLDPHASSPALTEAEVDGKEEKEQHEEVEERSEPHTEATDDAVAETPVDSVDQSKPPSSSSSSSTSSPPVYRSSSSSLSSKKKRAKAKSGAGCVNCHQDDRQAELMLCDRFGCENSCHYDCTVPPLSHVPQGSWFCAVCKPLVKQALDEEESLVVRPSNEEEKKRASAMEEEDAEEEDDPDQLEEISPERWRLAQEQWRRDREQYRKELAEKNAEVECLRAEVERFKRQRVERDDVSMEEESKESPMQEEHKQSPEPHIPADDEQKESLPNKQKTSTPSRRQPRRAK